jgi:hypothetical protein
MVCSLRNLLVHTNTIGIGTDGLVSVHTQRAIHADEVGHPHIRGWKSAWMGCLSILTGLAVYKEGLALIQ